MEWNKCEKKTGRVFLQNLLGETDYSYIKKLSHHSRHPEREPNAGFPEEHIDVPTINCEI